LKQFRIEIMRLFAGLLNVLMTAVFLLSVAVQYNDPDPLAWIIIYGLASALCLALALGRLRWWYALVTSVTALLWAAFLLPSFWRLVSAAEIFESIGMKTAPVEQAREFGGLMIVAAWMLFIAFYQRHLVSEASRVNRIDQ
jgi:hypothetical protein